MSGVGEEAMGTKTIKTEAERNAAINNGEDYCGCCARVRGEVKLRFLRQTDDGTRLHICSRGNGCQSK